MSITPPRDEASVAVRQRLYVDAKRAAVWGVGVNFLLLLSKMTVGIAAGSAALIADAVNSIGDVASSMAVRGALGMAQLEEDDFDLWLPIGRVATRPAQNQLQP